MSITDTLQRPTDTSRHTNTYHTLRGTPLAEPPTTGQTTVVEPTPSPAERQRQRDRAIEDQAKAALRASAYHAVRGMSCEVNGGVLTLRGCVPSFHMKQVAQTEVQHLLESGMTLDNQLEVGRT